MQQKYWDFLVQVRLWLFYLDEYAENSHKWEQRINIFCAVTSSASIAAWAIWTPLSIVWAFLIAISNVIAAIKDYLPFAKRFKMLLDFSGDLSLLYNKIEYNWYNVALGNLSGKEINDLYLKLQNEYTVMESKYMKKAMLAERNDMLENAQKKAKDFFESYLFECLE